jgi:cell division protein FtsQ
MGVRAMQWGARALLATALVLAAGGAAAWLAQRPWFDVRRIEVHGELRHVSGAAIRAAVAGRLRGNFFTMRLDEAQRVFEAVPWVAAASVRRAWPDRLVVTLTEHRALGVWSDGRILSDRGRLFVANVGEAELYGPLPEFDGPPQFAAEAARRFYEFSALLAPLALTVDAVRVSERASWSLETSAGDAPGPRFELGRDDPPGRLAERVAAIVAHYPRILARLSGPPARIDARYPNGFAAAVHRK